MYQEERGIIAEIELRTEKMSLNIECFSSLFGYL